MEEEYAGIFNNSKTAVPLRNILEAMGHTQTATTIVTDNETSMGISNQKLKPKHSKDMDM